MPIGGLNINPENPFNWGTAKKYFQLSVCCSSLLSPNFSYHQSFPLTRDANTGPQSEGAMALCPSGTVSIQVALTLISQPISEAQIASRKIVVYMTIAPGEDAETPVRRYLPRRHIEFLRLPVRVLYPEPFTSLRRTLDGTFSVTATGCARSFA
ncbi:hypothetical protein DL771_006146 [Monosporascus sp. 5C6A]|nr:hypothetical protein DL771_006146 [Monosporascus sp. 5C6A]